MSFTKINAAGIGSTETITINGLNVTGNASIGGTLTYEDVTNIDSVGLITARNGVVVGGGITLSKDGDGFFTGVVTATTFKGDGSQLTGVDSTALKDSNGNVKIQANESGAVHTGVTTTGAVSWGGHMLPTSNAAYDIGSADYKVRHLFLSDNSLKFVDSSDTEHPLSVDSGRLKFAGGLLLGDTIKVDEVSGIITATSINVGSGITLSPDGDGFFSGITTITSGTFGGGVLQENYNPAVALTGTMTHDAHTHGMILRSLANATGTFIINLRGDANTTFGSLLTFPKATTFTIYSASNNASYYLTSFQIDGVTQTVKWSGGVAPSAGTGSGVDLYSLTIIALGSNTYSVFGNFSNFA